MAYFNENLLGKELLRDIMLYFMDSMKKVRKKKSVYANNYLTSFIAKIFDIFDNKNVKDFYMNS